MSSSGLATQVCDTPLLRADVTRLDSLGEAPPLEDEGPLSGCHLLTQDAFDARQVLREVQRFGQDVRQLYRNFPRRMTRFSLELQPPLFGALLCPTMREHDQSDSHQHVPAHIAAQT